MKLTKDEKLQLNAFINGYTYTLNKINMVLHNDENTFERKKYLLNVLDQALNEVWNNYVQYTTGK